MATIPLLDLWQNIKLKDVKDGRESPLPDPQLVELQPEFNQPRQSDDLD